MASALIMPQCSVPSPSTTAGGGIAHPHHSVEEVHVRRHALQSTPRCRLRDEPCTPSKRLEANDLYFPECQIQNAAVETYIHYRPELFLDGLWVSFDATNPTGAYLTETYSVVRYSEGANTELCTIT